MRDKRAWIFVAFLVNLALLPMVVGVPRGQAQVRGDRWSSPVAKRPPPGSATAAGSAASWCGTA